MRRIRILQPGEWPAYQAHLLRLDPEARRLRFGFPIDDRGICTHLSQLEATKDSLLALVESGRVIGAAHLARARGGNGVTGGIVEFAFSVDAGSRHKGLGRALFERALLWARNRGLRRAFVYFLASNHVMARLARKCGMIITSAGGECEGTAALPPPTLFSVSRELAAERWALWEEQHFPLPRPLLPRPGLVYAPSPSR